MPSYLLGNTQNAHDQRPGTNGWSPSLDFRFCSRGGLNQRQRGEDDDVVGDMWRKPIIKKVYT